MNTNSWSGERASITVVDSSLVGFAVRRVYMKSEVGITGTGLVSDPLSGYKHLSRFLLCMYHCNLPARDDR